jgi:hypothetical protein
MLKPTFTLTMEIPTPFVQYLPELETELIANIIHDGIKAKSISFTGSIPLTLRVKRINEEAV